MYGEISFCRTRWQLGKQKTKNKTKQTNKKNFPGILLTLYSGFNSYFTLGLTQLLLQVLLTLDSRFTHYLLWVHSHLSPVLLTFYSWFYLQFTPGFTYTLFKVYSHFTPGLLTLCFWLCSHFTPGLHTLHFGFTLMLEMERSAQPCWMLTLW